MRHALPEWRLWDSPRSFSNAYRGVIQQHYDYFVQAAVSRAENGDKGAALGAVTGALRVFPIRAGYHLIVPHPLRSAFIRVLAPRPRAST